jgi:hypothetical protein
MGHLAAGTWRHGTKNALTRGVRVRVFQGEHALCFPRISSGAYSDATIAARFSQSACSFCCESKSGAHIASFYPSQHIYFFASEKLKKTTINIASFVPFS